MKEKQAKEKALPIYEKEIIQQLAQSVETLLNEAPLDPKWGVKKNSEGGDKLSTITTTEVYKHDGILETCAIMRHLWTRQDKNALVNGVQEKIILNCLLYEE